MLRTELPEVHGAGVLPFSGVGHVKDIAQLRLLAACVYKGNAGGTAPDKAPHLLFQKSYSAQAVASGR